MIDDPGEFIVGDNVPLKTFILELGELLSSNHILISGETGTGKTLFARFIHANSPNRNNVFLTIDCKKIPPELLEVELFGSRQNHRGMLSSFRKGVLHLAQNGTILLEEITCIHPELQLKIAHYLNRTRGETSESNRGKLLNARLIGTMRKNSTGQMGPFNLVEELQRDFTKKIELPPLRARKDDIPQLVNHFIKKYRIRYHKTVEGIDAGVLQTLMEYDWPGNIGELDLVIELAVLHTNHTLITENDLGKEQLKNVGLQNWSGVQKSRLEKYLHLFLESYLL